MISDYMLKKFEMLNNLVIPEIYKDFLKKYNGYSFGGGKILYSLDDIKEMNLAQQIQKYQPGYIAIGDDGAGIIFLMKQDTTSNVVYLVDMGDYDINSCYLQIDNFAEWFEKKCDICKKYPKKDDDIVDVFLTKSPGDDLKDLLKIKKAFSLNITAKELLLISKNVPCKLISGINIHKAKKMVQNTNHPDIFSFLKH